MLNLRPLFAFTALTAFAAAQGCAKDPSADAPAAQVAEAKAESPAAVASPNAAGALAPAADDETTGAILLTGSIGFTGSKVTGSHDGVFKVWTGALRLGPTGKPEGGSLHFTVQTASVDTDKANPMKDKLDKHLKSADFFDVEQFPNATFATTEITAGGQDGASHTLTGKLSLHGVTKDIRFPATISVAGKSVGGKADFTINRKDFKIIYPGMPDDLIRDGVVLHIDVHATLP